MLKKPVEDKPKEYTPTGKTRRRRAKRRGWHSTGRANVSDVKAQTRAVLWRKEHPKFHNEAACSICRHPRRQEIERAYMDWWTRDEIEKEFYPDMKDFYRHARETTLDVQRCSDIHDVLNFLINRGIDQNPVIDGRTLGGLVRLKAQTLGIVGNDTGGTTNILMITDSDRENRMKGVAAIYGIDIKTPQLETAQEVEYEEVAE